MAACKRLVGNFFIMQKIAAVTVSNSGIGRGVWSVPRARTGNVLLSLYTGKKEIPTKTCSCLPNYMQPFCQERYINCRFFSFFQPAAARQETTYRNLLLIHSLLVEELDFILFALIFSDLNQPCRSSVSVSASRTVECSGDGFFFQSVIRVTAGFLFPPSQIWMT